MVPRSRARLRWIRAGVPLAVMSAVALVASCGSSPKGGVGADDGAKRAPRLVYVRTAAGQGDHGGEIGTVRIDGTDPHAVLSVSGQFADPRMQTSPSGRYLVIATSGATTVRPRLVLFDLSAGRRLAAADMQYGPERSTGGLSLNWAPREATFVYRDEREAHLVDVATGKVTTPAGLTSVAIDLRWSDDGGYLAGCSMLQPQVWSSSGARTAPVRDPAGRGPSCNQWGWDGNTLLFDPIGQPRLYTLDPVTGQVRPHSTPPNPGKTDFRLHNKEPQQQNCPPFEHVRLMATRDSGQWALGEDERWTRLDTDPPCDRVLSPSRRRWAAVDGGHLITGVVGNDLGNDSGKDSGTPVHLTSDGSTMVTRAVFTRDEQHLILQTGEPLQESGNDLYLAAVGGSGIRRITGAVGALHLSASDDASAWAYSPAVDRLIAVRADQRSFVVTDGSLTRTRTIPFPSGGQLLAPPRLRLSPDGRYALLESGSAAGDLVIDLAAGRRYELSPAGGGAQVFWPAELAVAQRAP